MFLVTSKANSSWDICRKKNKKAICPSEVTLNISVKRSTQHDTHGSRQRVLRIPVSHLCPVKPVLHPPHCPVLESQVTAQFSSQVLLQSAPHNPESHSGGKRRHAFHSAFLDCFQVDPLGMCIRLWWFIALKFAKNFKVHHDRDYGIHVEQMVKSEWPEYVNQSFKFCSDKYTLAEETKTHLLHLHGGRAFERASHLSFNLSHCVCNEVSPKTVQYQVCFCSGLYSAAFGHTICQTCLKQHKLYTGVFLFSKFRH